MAALGGFLALAAFFALSSGEGGVIVLPGVLLAIGATGLLAFAGLRFLRPPSPAVVNEPVSHGPLQRIVLVIIGAMAFAWSGNAVVSGKLDASGSRRDVVRSENPSQFWQAVSIYALAGAACLYLGLRSSPGGGAGSASRPRRSGSARRR